MKSTITILLLILICTSNAQTIGFKSQNQDVVESQKNYIDLDVVLTAVAIPNPIEDVGFKITCKFKNKKGDQKIEMTDVISLDALSKTKSIRFYLDLKSIETDTRIEFTLNKLRARQKLSFSEKNHYAFFKKSIIHKIGFSSNDLQVKFDKNKVDTLKIPLKIIAQDYAPVKNDGVQFSISISEFENETYNVFSDYSKTYLLDANSSKQNELMLFPITPVVDKTASKDIKDTNEANKKKFREAIDLLIEKGSFELTLNYTPKAGSNIILDETRKTLKIITRHQKDKKFSYDEVNKRKYDLHIGTNFDLKDKLKANSFYSELSVFLPDLFDDFIGMRAGIYQNSNVSNRNTSELNVAEIQEGSITESSITVVRNRIERITTIEYNNIGFYAGVLFTWGRDKKKDSNIKVFALLNAELIERNETSMFQDTTLFQIETIETTPEDLVNNRSLLNDLRKPETKRKYYSSYWGVGMPVIYNNDAIEVSLIPIIGLGSPGIDIKNGRNIYYFGSMQFYLMEKEFGIKISGDIRTYFGFGDQDPIATLSLSKSFDISSLLKSNK